MSSIYVIQAGRTTWDEQKRVESAAGAPLTDEAIETVRDSAGQLAGLNITALYACTVGQAERQTADMVSGVLGGIKIHSMSSLHELDYGLWQGLMIDEIKHRHGRSYRQWLKCPDSMCPPEGETPAEAQNRLAQQLPRIVKRSKGGPALLVLRPLLAGLLKCLALNDPVDNLWNHVDTSLRWACYDLDDQALRGKSI